MSIPTLNPTADAEADAPSKFGKPALGGQRGGVGVGMPETASVMSKQPLSDLEMSRLPISDVPGPIIGMPSMPSVDEFNPLAGTPGSGPRSIPQAGMGPGLPGVEMPSMPSIPAVDANQPSLPGMGPGKPSIPGMGSGLPASLPPMDQPSLQGLDRELPTSFGNNPGGGGAALPPSSIPSIGRPRMGMPSMPGVDLPAVPGLDDQFGMPQAGSKLTPRQLLQEQQPAFLQDSSAPFPDSASLLGAVTPLPFAGTAQATAAGSQLVVGSTAAPGLSGLQDTTAAAMQDTSASLSRVAEQDRASVPVDISSFGYTSMPRWPSGT